MKGAALTLASLLGCSIAAPLQALPDDREQPIEIEADRALRDEKRGFTVYTGSVRLVQGSIVIEGDRLTIFHRNDSAESVVAEGNPARMQQRPSLEEPLMHAAGLRITYHVADERVELRQEASVEQDGAVVTGDRIDYLIPEQLVRADGSGIGGERVQVVIPPRALESDQNTNPQNPQPAQDKGVENSGQTKDEAVDGATQRT